MNSVSLCSLVIFLYRKLIIIGKWITKISLDEKYSEFCLACGKQYRTMEEFIDHAMNDPWNDESKPSSYFKYIDERETSEIINFREYTKNKLTKGNS